MKMSAQPNEKPVRYQVQDGVATVTLDRPDVLNAMNNAMRTELMEIFTRLRTDDGVRVVVVELSQGMARHGWLEMPVVAVAKSGWTLDQL